MTMKTDKKKNDKKSNKKPVVIIIVAVLLVFSAATVLVLWLNGVFEPKTEKHEDSKGVVGVITDDWDPGVEEPTSEARKGTRIPGYSSAEMNAGDTSLVMSIGNPKENSVGFYASVVLEDGTVLYESVLLKPGQGLTEIPLNRTLDKGVYTAKVVYKCVTLDDSHTPLNSAESGFTLYVN